MLRSMRPHFSSTAKGQSKSKAKYQVLPYSEKPTKFFTFFALASKKWLKQKIKALDDLN